MSRDLRASGTVVGLAGNVGAAVHKPMSAAACLTRGMPLNRGNLWRFHVAAADNDAAAVDPSCDTRFGACGLKADVVGMGGLQGGQGTDSVNEIGQSVPWDLEVTGKELTRPSASC